MDLLKNRMGIMGVLYFLIIIIVLNYRIDYKFIKRC